MEALGRVLLRNDSLTALNVGENKFGISGLTSLAFGLKINKGLTTLLLDKNSLGDSEWRLWPGLCNASGHGIGGQQDSDHARFE
jgi:hypothetical protein